MKYLLVTFFLFVPSVVFAADLDITCYSDRSPEIVRNVDPLFQLSGFVPGSSASRTIYVQNTDPENNCRIYFEATGDDNILTDKIKVEVSEGLFSGSLSEYIDNTKILMANLSQNTDVTRTISMTLPTDAGNTYASKKASFDITVVSEWGDDTIPDTTLEDTGGDVAGTTDEASSSTRSAKTFFTELLGIGGPEPFVEDDETENVNGEVETEEEQEEEDILGEEEVNGACEKTLWWLPIIIQLILTLVIISWEGSLLKKRSIKLGISAMLGLAAYFATQRIGCGCNLIWLCENHWILNILIALFPALTYAKRKDTEYPTSEFNSTDYQP